MKWRGRWYFIKPWKKFFSNLFSTWEKWVSLNCGNFCRTTHVRNYIYARSIWETDTKRPEAGFFMQKSSSSFFKSYVFKWYSMPIQRRSYRPAHIIEILSMTHFEDWKELFYFVSESSGLVYTGKCPFSDEAILLSIEKGPAPIIFKIKDIICFWGIKISNFVFESFQSRKHRAPSRSAVARA